MRTDFFDFDLPSELIALRPAFPRDTARLMVVNADGGIEHSSFNKLKDHLHTGDILALNDSRVIPARLEGRRAARAEAGPDVTIEVTLHKRERPGSFTAFVQPAKRLRTGDILAFGGELSARVERLEAGLVCLEFNYEGGRLDRAIAEVGAMPLPPYIAKKRVPDRHDLTDYQTVYAKHDGSVAAPTAGLHFTDGMLAELAELGIPSAYVTLHVGAGTFLPVASENVADHVMHSERAIVTPETALRLNAVHARGARIVAVGTTGLRTLESAADADGKIHPFEADTRIFITPGYRFRAVDVLLTNFHLPRSTLFMLVSAFAGLDIMKRAYAAAIAERYRFYSYGDACLLFRPR